MTATSQGKIILGIDPGTAFFGYGVIKINGKNLELISLGTVDLSKFPTHHLKLKRIFERVCYLIDEYRPQSCAVEAPFFGKNVQSMLKLGRAQGVAMAAAMVNNIPVTEYSPKKIKVAVTGNGNASKEQVAAMLQQLFSFKELPKYQDATDGLAAAVCHHFQNRHGLPGSQKSTSWKEFISANPGRVVR